MLLLKGGGSHAATRRVFAACDALLDRGRFDRDFNNPVMDLVVSLAAPAVLQRPVVVYTDGLLRDRNDVLLGAGHSAPRERVFHPQPLKRRTAPSSCTSARAIIALCLRLSCDPRRERPFRRGRSVAKRKRDEVVSLGPRCGGRSCAMHPSFSDEFKSLGRWCQPRRTRRRIHIQFGDMS